MKSTLVNGLLVLIFTMAGLVPAVAQQKNDSVEVCTLKVTGMTCAGCEVAVRRAAKTVNGVKDVKASYDKSDAEVTYDAAKTTPDAIAKVITQRSGFKAIAEPDRKK